MIPRAWFWLACLSTLNFYVIPALSATAVSEALSGQRLNAAEAKALEAAVAKQPDDLSARTKLLGYYFLGSFSKPAAKTARRSHIFWIIQHQPAAKIAGLPFCNFDPIQDPDDYAQAKTLWLEQAKTQPTNPAVLGNAANFFQLHDRSRAEALLLQAQTADPANPEWSDQLGNLYALSSDTGPGAATKSLQQFERAQAADPNASSRYYRLDSLAKQAFAADKFKSASRYANELLAAASEKHRDWNYGNAILMGNTVLGRIALRQGQLQAAKAFLLKAGQTPGSPQLNSFGPNMSLAKELVVKGEKDAVIEYFDLCRKFWSMGTEKLDLWTKEVKAGRVPDFGANLIY